MPRCRSITLQPLLAGHPLQPAGDGVLAAVDVGCGAFQYATALHRLSARAAGARRVVLRGIEVDGHGIYRDGHSRADHARAHAALAADDVSFTVADFTAIELPPQDVVTMLFPFVLPYPLLQWGLPLELYRPRRLLRRAASVLRPAACCSSPRLARARGVAARRSGDMRRSVNNR